MKEHAPVRYEDYIKISQDVGVKGDNHLDNSVTMVTTNFGTLFSKRMRWALKNQMFNFDRQMVNHLNFRTPLPIFFCDELLRIGATGKVDIMFGISTNWYKKT